MKIISKEKRKKMITMLVFVPIVPAFIIYKHLGILESAILIATCWSIAILSLINELFATLTYHYGKRLFKKIGEILSHIALLITYILAVLPTGLVMKIVKRDKLLLKKQNKTSYWKDVEKTEHTYENQF